VHVHGVSESSGSLSSPSSMSSSSARLGRLRPDEPGPSSSVVVCVVTLEGFGEMERLESRSTDLFLRSRERLFLEIRCGSAVRVVAVKVVGVSGAFPFKEDVEGVLEDRFHSNRTSTKLMSEIPPLLP